MKMYVLKFYETLTNYIDYRKLRYMQVFDLDYACYHIIIRKF